MSMKLSPCVALIWCRVNAVAVWPHGSHFMLRLSLGGLRQLLLKTPQDHR